MTAPLPRRAFLGARLPPDSQAFSSGGARVIGTVPMSMAAAAGLEAGDRLVSIGGLPTRSLPELATALRRAGGVASVEIAYVRHGSALARRVDVRHMPEENVPGARTAYRHIDVGGGVRLRTILTHPLDEEAAPAVLVLQGISCESVDFGAGPPPPLGQLVHGWAQAGFVTMRVDKRGVGDSEGGPCAATDFDTELDDFGAALRALVVHPMVDPERIFLFGHSVGGMIAPLLAARRRVRGLMVYGTSTARWLECVIASQRRQMQLRGVPPVEIATQIADLRARLTHDPPNGRSAAYHQQLDAVDLAAVWAQVDAPLLVLRGEHDWVVGADEQEQLGALVEGRRPGSATLADLDGLDHLLSWHATLADSLKNYGTGEFDEALLTCTIAWMQERALRSPA